MINKRIKYLASTCYYLMLISVLQSTDNISVAGDRKEKPSVNLTDVYQAQKRITPVAYHTPLIEEENLSRICGARVFLKLENLQLTGSFKTRGAFNKIASLSKAQRAKGVIAASAGNHAQGVALAAKLFNITATIVMPVNVPKTKLEATRAHGAQVVLYGKNFDESLAEAIKIQKQTGAIFIHPFDDPLTIAGQGTIGLEIIEDLPDVDVVLVPVGGGGLASGIAVAIKGLRPECKIIGVEPENIASMLAALRKGAPITVEANSTIAEGTAVAKVGNFTHKLVKQLLAKVVTVSEDEINEAIVFLLLKDKILAEGAGALGAAAILSKKLDLEGKKVVIVISGGNIDAVELQKVLAEYIAK